MHPLLDTLAIIFEFVNTCPAQAAVTEATGVGDATYSLVGIAGSFMGFHLAVILGLLPSPLMFYAAAVIGAVVTIWLWRGR
jgi:uncharacterized membrane protein YeaQ/YmgE (transglycosylase-associated protein family)